MATAVAETGPLGLENPMGTDGFEFVEYTAPDIELLRSLFGLIGAFVVGWIVQFVGHWFEGRKPAFVDDLIGLAVGPLFVVAEVAFFAGLRGDLRREVERRAGPLRGGAHSHV